MIEAIIRPFLRRIISAFLWRVLGLSLGLEMALSSSWEKAEEMKVKKREKGSARRSQRAKRIGVAWGLVIRRKSVWLKVEGNVRKRVYVMIASWIVFHSDREKIERRPNGKKTQRRTGKKTKTLLDGERIKIIRLVVHSVVISEKERPSEGEIEEKKVRWMRKRDHGVTKSMKLRRSNMV
jgi:hypothetical protein